MYEVQYLSGRAGHAALLSGKCFLILYIKMLDLSTAAKQSICAQVVSTLLAAKVQDVLLLLIKKYIYLFCPQLEFYCATFAKVQ